MQDMQWVHHFRAQDDCTSSRRILQWCKQGHSLPRYYATRWPIYVEKQEQEPIRLKEQEPFAPISVKEAPLAPFGVQKGQVDQAPIGSSSPLHFSHS
jgi:hypothetical protein